MENRAECGAVLSFLMRNIAERCRNQTAHISSLHGGTIHVHKVLHVHNVFHHNFISTEK